MSSYVKKTDSLKKSPYTSKILVLKHNYQGLMSSDKVHTYNHNLIPQTQLDNTILCLNASVFQRCLLISCDQRSSSAYVFTRKLTLYERTNYEYLYWMRHFSLRLAVINVFPVYVSSELLLSTHLPTSEGWTAELTVGLW